MNGIPSEQFGTDEERIIEDGHASTKASSPDEDSTDESDPPVK